MKRHRARVVLHGQGTYCPEWAVQMDERSDGEWVKHEDATAAIAEATAPVKLRPLAEYHEDMGAVLWWHIPIQEPPHSGWAGDSGFIDDWHTHWSPLPNVVTP